MLRVNNEKYDVICEGLDGYFEQKASHLTEQQKSLLPRKLMIKLFRKGGRVATNLNTNKLNMIEKLYVLFKSFKTRWFIVVEDEDGDVFQDWDERKKGMKKRQIGEPEAQALINSGSFVLGAKELVNGFYYLNEISAAAPYNFLVGAKNKPRDIAHWKRQRGYIAAFIENYESQKRKFLVNSGINLSEWYILVHIYNDREVQSSRIYKEVFKYAYAANATQIKTALSALQSKGYIVKHGVTKGATIKITAHGLDLVHQIMSKYIINF